MRKPALNRGSTFATPIGTERSQSPQIAQKWLGESAKGCLGLRCEIAEKVSCIGAKKVCTGANRACTGARDLLFDTFAPEPQTTFSIVTGEHWTGSPHKSIDQIGKNCPKNVRKLCFQPLQTICGPFSDIFFRHFSDILSAFPFSALSNALPVTTFSTLP